MPSLPSISPSDRQTLKAVAGFVALLAVVGVYALVTGGGSAITQPTSAAAAVHLACVSLTEADDSVTGDQTGNSARQAAATNPIYQPLADDLDAMLRGEAAGNHDDALNDIREAIYLRQQPLVTNCRQGEALVGAA